jgi:hypothetical protein
MSAWKKQRAAADDDYENRRLELFCADEIDRFVFKVH